MWVEDVKQCAALYRRWHYYLSWWKAACFLQLVSKALDTSHLLYCLSKEFESVIVDGRLWRNECCISY